MPEESLDEALSIEGKDSLVVIEEDHFVMFHEHAPGKYHGYIVEKYKGLRDFAQETLSKARLVNPKTGKIRKR